MVVVRRPSAAVRLPPPKEDRPMHRRVITGVVAAVLAAGAVLGLPGSAGAVGPGTDFCQGQCNDILPPGENGNATLADILAHKVFGTRPAHSADQLPKYANLVNSYAGLTDSQLGSFYNDSSFGVLLSQVERIDKPRSDVMIVRDRPTGVPHVFGTTRAGTMFGAGYAGAQDKLFLMDLMRHLGRGQLSSFAGGAPGNRALEQSVWRNSPYHEADLQAQVDRLRARSAQLWSDLQNYLAGVNAYIGACMAGRYCPGEYVLTGHLDAVTNAGGPQPFVPADVVAIAGVVGGLFGGGGGGELQSALVRLAARAKFGEALGGPGRWVRGVSFAGLNLYVQIGRGPDYAWRATSAEQDITDTFAVPLCTVDGSRPTLSATHYLYHGQCLPMEVLEQDDAWTPTTADSTPAGSYKRITLRTKYGLVSARAMLGGAPVAYTSLRSTYRHEADSAFGFAMFDDPAQMATAAGFQQAAANVGYAFNWFYVNSTDAAYFNSGLNPVRAAGADPNLPVRADPAFEWQGWNPDTNTANYTPPAQHPNSVNQDYYVSWNNKQAKGYSAADGNFAFGAVFRADLLDRPVGAAVHSGQKLDRAGLVRLVEDAATTDLRAIRELPNLIRVLTSQPVTDPKLSAAIGQLQAWYQAGARRKETSPGSHVYQFADAIRIFDAWWPLLVAAQFQGTMGPALFGTLATTPTVDESPSGVQHHGSAYQNGWWGYVDKDLRAVLGDPVAGPLGRVFCGGGNLAACRQALLGALGQAAGATAATVYPGDSFCAAGNQWCADAIVQLPLGGITDPPITWQNRPTYQQVVSFPAHR